MFHPIKEEKSGLNIQIRNKFEDYSSVFPRWDGVHDCKRETKHWMYPFFLITPLCIGQEVYRPVKDGHTDGI